MKRRHFLMAGAGALAAAPFASPAPAQTDPQELLAPGPLPERSFGPANAPVTVIEYASLTCGHCRRFHLDAWPAIKARYVDTGKVRFIIREFPFDPRASGGFMLARCAGDEKWYPVLDLLYRSQDTWARAENAVDALVSVMAVTGMNRTAVEACLRDQPLLEKITAVADRAKALGVDSTPTFFINGQVHKGVLMPDRFAEIVEPLLAAAQ